MFSESLPFDSFFLSLFNALPSKGKENLADIPVIQKRIQLARKLLL